MKEENFEGASLDCALKLVLWCSEQRHELHGSKGELSGMAAS